mmetsp:Transcript_144224/g.461840  ORF Transcript_144224/g.461840 Transcript_144224/m.461840 type:complete len:232 (+) Transcript_144224:2200-2895(+)
MDRRFSSCRRELSRSEAKRLPLPAGCRQTSAFSFIRYFPVLLNRGKSSKVQNQTSSASKPKQSLPRTKDSTACAVSVLTMMQTGMEIGFAAAAALNAFPSMPERIVRCLRRRRRSKRIWSKLFREGKPMSEVPMTASGFVMADSSVVAIRITATWPFAIAAMPLLRIASTVLSFMWAASETFAPGPTIGAFRPTQFMCEGGSHILPLSSLSRAILRASCTNCGGGKRSNCT